MVRTHFSRLKENYEKLFKSIELNDKSQVEWKSTPLSLPIVPSKKTVMAGKIVPDTVSLIKDIKNDQLSSFVAGSIQTTSSMLDKSNCSVANNIDSDFDSVKENQIDATVQDEDCKSNTCTDNTAIESIVATDDENTVENSLTNEYETQDITSPAEQDSDHAMLPVVSLINSGNTEDFQSMENLEVTNGKKNDYSPNQTSVWENETGGDTYIESFKSTVKCLIT